MSVALNDGSTRELTFDKLIIATGAVTRMLPGVQVSQNVVTYEEQILDAELPGDGLQQLRVGLAQAVDVAVLGIEHA